MIERHSVEVKKLSNVIYNEMQLLSVNHRNKKYKNKKTKKKYIYIEQTKVKTLKVSCEVPFYITRFAILTV